MNKSKLLKLADEVLTDIDIDLEVELRKNLEEKLCTEFGNKFIHARRHLVFPNQSEVHKKDYKSVKPILDSCIDKLLGKQNDSDWLQMQENILEKQND